jgi:DNA-binding NarL/FixJ family response regulator
MLTRPRPSHSARHRAPRRSGGLPIHVLLVDDHPVVRHGVRRLIADQPDLTTIAEASRADVAAGELARWADVAVIDYHLGGRDGLWLTRQIRERPGAPRVLMYSAFADHPLTVAAIVAGADGLLPKHALHTELCDTIRALARGRRRFPAVPAALVRALRTRLAPDDQPIYDGLMQSLDAGELMEALGLSAAELEYRRAAMLRALRPEGGSVGGYGPLDYDRPRRARAAGGGGA